MKLFTWLSLTLACLSSYAQPSASGERFIEVSKINPAYFAYSDGSPFIPVGINLINPSGKYGNKPDSAFYEIEQWMKNLSDNGGNYIRIWLSQSFWDIEDKKAGTYDEAKAARIDRFFQMARKHRLKVKVTLEHFRSITLQENPQRWATKFIYHKSQGGPLDSVSQYITSEAGQRLFLDKVNYYQNRYGSDTLFFGWELWNEMNAVSVPLDSSFLSWNEKMLSAVKKTFPHNLVMQSLGSFDNENVRPLYKKVVRMPGNEVAQIHRYLDLGAKMDVCHAPMDVICASATNELLSYQTGKPVVLAETGAVEPNHAGPSRYYDKDTAGILLHDILFAPFFSGSAAPGMSWHWESYVDKNNLWYHYGRFNEAVKGINPIAESFRPIFKETEALRIYVLKGKNNTLIWIRDKKSNWNTELEQQKSPPKVSGVKFDYRSLGLSATNLEFEVYDPWTNNWSLIKPVNKKLTLPDFTRSIVIRTKR